MLFRNLGAGAHHDTINDNLDRRCRSRLNLDKMGTAAESAVTVPLRTAWRRHPNSCEGAMPSRRAIAETFAPGASVSATSCDLNAPDQFRRTRCGAPSSRAGTASITWKLLSSGIGADIETDTDIRRPIPCHYA